MTEAHVKEGFALAEKEMREKQVTEVKKIVLKTLEKIKEQEKIRDDASKKVKILKMDIDDLKDGKIDRIVERQEKDEEAKRTSVVIIIKETVNNYSPWYMPYRVVWPQQTYYYADNGLTALTTTTFGNAVSAGWSSQAASNYATINCSAAKESTVGAYEVEGTIINLR